MNSQEPNAQPTGEPGFDPLDISGDILVDIIDETGAVVALNREQRLYLGIDAPTVGFDIADLYDRRSTKAIWSLFERSVPNGYRTTIELSLLGRGGRELPIQADYLGHSMATDPSEWVTARLVEIDGEDAVLSW